MSAKTNIGHLEPITNLEEASEIGNIMLDVSRRIKKVEQ